MSSRSFNTNSSRYGFNSKEKDDEINGNGNSVDFGARIYDNRLGRWLAVDRFEYKYPNISPYSFGLNNPIVFKDEDGKWITDVNGKPIYTVGSAVAHELDDGKGGKVLLLGEVRYYYTNDGQAIYTVKYNAMVKPTNYKVVGNDFEYSTAALETPPDDLTYDCHGNSCFPGENIYIPGNDPDGNPNSEKIFKNKSEYTPVPKSEAKKGDIKLFGANGALNHSATKEGQNNAEVDTYTSKDDRKPIRTGVTVYEMTGTVDANKGTWGTPLKGNYRHNENKNGGVESKNGEVTKEAAATAVSNVKAQ